jgi:hypothetical protein
MFDSTAKSVREDEKRLDLSWLKWPLRIAVGLSVAVIVLYMLSVN